MIRLYCAVHKRPEMTRMFLRNLEFIREETGKELPLTAVYSTEEDKELLEEFNVDQIVYADNEPLSYKNNIGLGATFDREWDRLIQLGSDSLITKDMIYAIENTKHDFTAFNKCYFYDQVTDEAVLWEMTGYIGSGRSFSRSMLAKCWASKYVTTRTFYHFRKGQEHFVPDGCYRYYRRKDCISVSPISKERKFMLWQQPLMKGLDRESNRVLEEIGYKVQVIEGIHQVEIKGDFNITPFKRIKSRAKVIDKSIPLDLIKYERLQEI